MKIAIDALGIDMPGGGRTSILNLLYAIFSQDHINKYVVFLSKHETCFDKFSENVEQYLIPSSNRFLTRIKLQDILLHQRHCFDLIHFTKNLGAFGLDIPYVLTIHDLTTVLHSELVPKIDYIYWRTIEKYTVKNASKVIAVSKNAAGDISKYYNIPLEKIAVIYHGCSDNFHPAASEIVSSVREKYNLPQNYLLHVGRIDQKKNLNMLVEAFDQIIKNSNFNGGLVLVGEEYRKSPDLLLHKTIERLNLQEKVFFTGRVPDEHLPALYSGALACVFPSVHEGFGLFALEAMACGTPLIVNSAGALEEVVGDAGIIIREINPHKLANAIEKVVSDKELQERMKRTGLDRAKQFSWNIAAEEVLKIYDAIGIWNE